MRRLLNLLILTFFLVAFPILVYSETIDVLIKGVDDGVKTNKQQDYKEAVMNAKLEAIERAGVEITSITKIVNFKTKYDKVESKAKAALLPGFQIMDMGYQSDGTYTVVLSGKVQAGKDAEDRAKRRKQAIQKEISTLEAKLADVEYDINRAEARYENRRRDLKRSVQEGFNQCDSKLRGRSLHASKLKLECYQFFKEQHDKDLRKANDTLNRELTGLPEKKTQLELRLSDLRMELSEYPSDTEDTTATDDTSPPAEQKIEMARLSPDETKYPSLKEEIIRRGELLVGFASGYMPFEMVGRSRLFIGYDIDQAKEMAKRLGVRFVPVNTAWNNLIPALLRSEFDIIISGMSIIEQRKQRVEFSEPYLIDGQTILLAKKHEGKVKSYKDLNNRKYIVTSRSRTTSEQAVKRLIPKAKYKSFKTEVEAASKVLNGKADAFVYDLAYCVVFNASMGKGKLVFLDKPFTSKQPLGIAIRKGDPQFLNWLNDFIRQINNDGTHEQIYNRWFESTDWARNISNWPPAIQQAIAKN